MSQIDTNSKETPQNPTPSMHHQKAAQQHDLASKLHRDAAKSIDTGDHKSAAKNAAAACEHAAKATEHGEMAGKQVQHAQGSQAK